MVDEEKVIEALKGVMDPHTGQDVYEMGLIRNLKIEGSTVSLEFVPSSPYCPLGEHLATSIKKAVQDTEGVERVDITVEGYVQKDALNQILKG
jgi:ATP-binding protein involved in chromosome partitioning